MNDVGHCVSVKVQVGQRLVRRADTEPLDEPRVVAPERDVARVLVDVLGVDAERREQGEDLLAQALAVDDAREAEDALGLVPPAFGEERPDDRGVGL